MKTTTILITGIRVPLVERIARRLGTTTTRCPYCRQWDPRPGSHLERRRP